MSSASDGITKLTDFPHQRVQHERHGERAPVVPGAPDVRDEQHGGMVVDVQIRDLPELVPQNHEHGVEELHNLWIRKKKKRR